LLNALEGRQQIRGLSFSMSIVTRFFPNGEFTQGVDTSHKRRDKIAPRTPQTLPLDIKRRDEYLQWSIDNAEMLNDSGTFQPGAKFLSASGWEHTLVSCTSNLCELQWQDSKGKVYVSRVSSCLRKVLWEWKLTPLVHQSVESCDNPQKPSPAVSRKKLTSMTKNMSRNIRNAVYLMEKQPGGKDVLSFLTLTLPDLSTDMLAQCCKHWDEMVKQFMDWLRIKLKRQHIEFQYVYCTEIQENRLQRRQEYAPHLHIIFRGRNGKKQPWAITPKQARKEWSNCISAFVNVPFITSALENLQRIKFSVARYLSKYLSKGRCAIPDTPPTEAIVSLHTQWGGMSRSLSAKIRATTTKIGGSADATNTNHSIIRYMDEFIKLGYVRYFRKGFIALGIDKITGMEYGLHVGSGCLSVPTYEGGLICIIRYLYEN